MLDGCEEMFALTVFPRERILSDVLFNPVSTGGALLLESAHVFRTFVAGACSATGRTLFTFEM